MDDLKDLLADIMYRRNEKGYGILLRQGMHGLANKALTADGMFMVMHAIGGETA